MANAPIGFEGAPPSGGGMTNNPPPTYQAVAGISISKVDFPPRRISSPGFFSSPEYERFDVLMQRANQWLMGNPQIIVIHVEGIETIADYRQDFGDTESSVYIEPGKQSSIYTRSLRLWVRSRGGSDPPNPQQLGYFNVIPNCLSSGGFLSMPEFEPFNITIDRINQHFRQQPLQGRIINLETEEIKMSSWGGNIDPDKCSWLVYGERGLIYIMVIRIFFELGPPAMEDIGCADFLPAEIDSGGWFSYGKAEPLNAIATRAHQWIQQQTGIRVTNIQTVEYKISTSWGGESRINSMRSSYHHRGKGMTRFLRIMRVCFTRSLRGEPVPPPPIMSYRTFTPYCLDMGGIFSLPKYTNQSSAVQIANAWLSATGAKVISAETVGVRVNTGGQNGDPEVTMVYNSGNVSEGILFVVRVFLDGVYRDPPPEALPQRPANATAAMAPNTECCTIL